MTKKMQQDLVMLALQCEDHADNQEQDPLFCFYVAARIRGILKGIELDTTQHIHRARQ